jgi:predicted amidohydrolase
MKIRVSAIQFAVTSDVDANLATVLRMIDEAAQNKPDIIVTPEFINHILWFDDTEHCWGVSLDLDSDFLKAIGAKAKEHNCYIKVNVTLRRTHPTVTGTNILFHPHGNQIAITDKQILMGNENNYLTPATEPAQIINTPFGNLGMYCCMDGVIPEPARALAVRGVHVLLNSLNSFAHDEASLHIPVRSGENKVYVVAANKIGALVPPHMAQAVADRLKIPAEAIAGAGESQILAPNGTILAKAPKLGEAAIYADIEVDDAHNKLRPDGTDILASRRPALYNPIADSPSPRLTPAGAASIMSAVCQPASSNISEIIQASKDVQLLVLPELTLDSASSLASLQASLQDSNTYLVTTIQENDSHIGILLNKDGILLRQPQLHACGRHPWATKLGDKLEVIDLPFGRLAIVVGGDAIYPEVFRLAVLQDVDVVAVPTKVLEAWEMSHGFLERSAENRMNVVVATQPSDAGTSAIFALDKDFTLWTQWEKLFDGNINYPIITRAPNASGLTKATIYPALASNKIISQKTNLVENRPWWLAKGIITA